MNYKSQISVHSLVIINEKGRSQMPEIQQELKARDETEEASARDLVGGARREDTENQILELVFSKIGNLRGKTLTAPRWRKILP